MIFYRVAYRFSNGEVEGFVGIGHNSKSAMDDAIRQIYRKVAIVRHVFKDEEFEESRLIKTFALLSAEEMKLVRADWKTGLRY